MDTLASPGVVEISERMLAHARDGDWDAVALLEAQRGPMIAALSLQDAAVLPVLKLLLAHTHAVRELAEQQRGRLDEALGQHQQRHRALSAYLQTGMG